jgi:hypothetical protein
VSRTSEPALRGTLLGTLLRLLNPFLRWLLESPVHWPLSRWFAVLAWKGRKTGRGYSTPVSFVREGSTAFVTTGDRWWRNLIDGAPVRMRVSGRWYTANAVSVTDHEESSVEHERLFHEHRWFRVLAGIPRGAGGGPDPAAVKRAIAAGRVLVRIEGLD